MSAARWLTGVEREMHIAQEAVRYFVEVGFAAEVMPRVNAAIAKILTPEGTGKHIKALRTLYK